MSKMRDADTELGQLTQFFIRKVLNHHPLSELEGDKDKVADPFAFGVQQKSVSPGKPNVKLKPGTENVIIYEEKGRTFQMTVEELTPDAPAPLIKIEPEEQDAEAE